MPLLTIFFASDLSCAHVFGTDLMPALANSALPVSVASGDQSFGKP